MSAHESIAAVLAEWQEWQDFGMSIDAPPQFQKVFKDGLNHDVALINTSYQDVITEQVLKCFSRPHPNAIKAQIWAAKLGVSPTINYSDPDGTYCVMDYVKGPTISPDAFSSQELAALASALNRIHSSSIPEFAKPLGVFDLLGFCERYLSSNDDQAKRIYGQMSAPLNAFIADTTPMCFCHNDLVVGNCVAAHGDMQLIDWEYSQLNNPWFDLAAIIYYLRLDDKKAAEFLDCYEAGWSVFVGTTIFYTSQISLLLTDILWHSANFGPTFWPRLETKLNDLEQLAKISRSLL